MFDLGIGHACRDMQLRLRGWGYDVSREACQEWLRKYRLAGSATEGICAVFELYRQDLRDWWYVDRLSPTKLQEKYVQVHGVYAERAYLVRWLSIPAQHLDSLDKNEIIHANPCGEYALQRLQRGARTGGVVLELLREYLVQVSEQRLQAYRRYREQSFEYLTARKLEAWHWEVLYDMVTLETIAVVSATRRSLQRQKYAEQCRSQRAQLCQAVGISEERLPLEVLTEFWQWHQRYARLPHGVSGGFCAAGRTALEPGGGVSRNL